MTGIFTAENIFMNDCDALYSETEDLCGSYREENKNDKS